MANRLRSQKYMAHVRSFHCLVCKGAAQAHHLQRVEGDGRKGMSMKTGDQWTVPLCHVHHAELHQWGKENVFWAIKGIKPFDWAEKTFAAWLATNGEDVTYE